MFGDKPMLGQTKLTIDDKNRIILPKCANSQSGEELIILNNKEFKVYEIYSIKRLEEKYKELDNIILNVKSKKGKKFYKKRLLELKKSVLENSIVSSDGGIELGETFKEYKEVICTGAYDRLIIEPVKIKK